MSDIMPVQVASLRHQGSTVSRRVCLMTFTITQWTERHSVLLEARYVPGKKNILADQLSNPIRFFRQSGVFCLKCSRSFAGSLANLTSICLLLGPTQSYHFVSPISDPQAWKQDALHLWWDHLCIYAFTPFALLRQVTTQVLELEGL